MAHRRCGLARTGLSMGLALVAMVSVALGIAGCRNPSNTGDLTTSLNQLFSEREITDGKDKWLEFVEVTTLDGRAAVSAPGMLYLLETEETLNSLMGVGRALTFEVIGEYRVNCFKAAERAAVFINDIQIEAAWIRGLVAQRAQLRAEMKRRTNNQDAPDAASEHKKNIAILDQQVLCHEQALRAKRGELVAHLAQHPGIIVVRWNKERAGGASVNVGSVAEGSAANAAESSGFAVIAGIRVRRLHLGQDFKAMVLSMQRSEADLLLNRVYLTTRTLQTQRVIHVAEVDQWTGASMGVDIDVRNVADGLGGVLTKEDEIKLSFVGAMVQSLGNLGSIGPLKSSVRLRPMEPRLSDVGYLVDDPGVLVDAPDHARLLRRSDEDAGLWRGTSRRAGAPIVDHVVESPYVAADSWVTINATLTRMNKVAEKWREEYLRPGEIACVLPQHPEGMFAIDGATPSSCTAWCREVRSKERLNDRDLTESAISLSIELWSRLSTDPSYQVSDSMSKAATEFFAALSRLTSAYQRAEGRSRLAPWCERMIVAHNRVVTDILGAIRAFGVCWSPGAGDVDWDEAQLVSKGDAEDNGEFTSRGDAEDNAEFTSQGEAEPDPMRNIIRDLSSSKHFGWAYMQILQNEAVILSQVKMLSRQVDVAIDVVDECGRRCRCRHVCASPPTPPPSPSPCGSSCGRCGDASGDGQVNWADIMAVLTAVERKTRSAGCDVTEDGVVDEQDLRVVLANFGMKCR